jgi:hypothetical protein
MRYPVFLLKRDMPPFTLGEQVLWFTRTLNTRMARRNADNFVEYYCISPNLSMQKLEDTVSKLPFYKKSLINIKIVKNWKTL